jgi:hypothetical protein
MHRARPSVIVSIKLAAFVIAAAPGYLLVYDYGFRGPLLEWGFIALGFLVYFPIRAVLAVWVGYVWGRQDARVLRRRFANLHAQVEQDIIDLSSKRRR